MFDLYNTLESYNIIGGGELEPSYEGIINGIKSVGKGIWGIIKKIWEGIVAALGGLKNKIKSAWDFIKRGGKKKSEDDYEEPYEIEEDDDDYEYEDDVDNSSNSHVNKFARGRGKNINRRRLKSKHSEDDSGAAAEKMPEPPEPEQTSRYKNRKLKGGKAGMNPNPTILGYKSGYTPMNIQKELNGEINMLSRICQQINMNAKRYKEALSILNAEAKSGKRLLSKEDAEKREDYYDDNTSSIQNGDIDFTLTKLENRIADKGHIRLTSKIPSVEKYFQKLFIMISKLQQSSGDILKHVDKKLGELKSKHKKYEFNDTNSSALSLARTRSGQSGKDIHDRILKRTKILSSQYNRINVIVSKFIMPVKK